jgi:hypothetical protein
MKRQKNTITSLRAEIEALQAERKALERQQLGRDDVRAAIEGALAHVDAEWQGRLDVAVRRVAGGGYGALSAISEALDPRSGHLTNATALAGLGGVETLRAALLARVDAVVPEGPNAAERRERIAAIDAELDRVELAEEQLIVQSEDEGRPVARRDNCRPEIVLAYVGDGNDAADASATPQAEIEVQQDRALRAAAAERHAEAMQPVKSHYAERRDTWAQ